MILADIAYTVGQWSAYILAIGIPVSLVFLVWWIPFLINKRKEREEIARIRSIQDAITRDAAERNARESAAKEAAEKAKWEKAKEDKVAQEAEEAQQRADQAIIMAMDELETGQLDKLTWGKALIAADGDEKRAKIEYLKLRKL